VSSIRIRNQEGRLLMEAMMNDFRQTREFIDQRLKEYMKNDEPLLKNLVESIDYSLFSGGKRIRPLFCFIVG